MSTIPQLVVVGYTNIDINITPSKKTVLPGGGAYFGSVAASKILEQVGLVTRVGTDYDTSFLYSRVLKDGIHVINKKLTGKSTQVYHSDIDFTKRDITVEWGVASDITTEDFPKSWLKNVKFIHISTMPPKQQYEFLLYIQQVAPDTYISIDSDIIFYKEKTDKNQVIKNFMLSNLIFMNRLEYKAIKKDVHKMKEVIIKLDEDGAMYMKDGKIIETVKAQKVDIVDVTGAGDIFAGTFLANKILGLSLQESLNKACIVATDSIREEGIKHLFTSYYSGLLSTQYIFMVELFSRYAVFFWLINYK